MKVKCIQAVVFFLFLLQITQAQTKNGIIQGKVIDAKTKQAIEFASVYVFSSKDSVLVSGNYTNNQGFFSISKLPQGAFYVVVEYLGYTHAKIRNIVLSDKVTIHKTGFIPLKPSAVYLNTVVVTAEKPEVDYKIDRKIITVSSNLMAQGGTALDAIKNIPSVQVDGDDNVSLRGSSNFLVFIDGVQSSLSGSDALKLIPADAIDNIEIITNPAASFDADGVGGILHIKTKKQKLLGTSALIGANYGLWNNYNVNAQVSYRQKKYILVAGGAISNKEKNMEGNQYQDITGDTIAYTSSAISNEMDRANMRGNFGVDYLFDTLHTLSVQSSFGKSEMKRGGNSYENNMITPSIDSMLSVQFTQIKRGFNTLQTDMVYSHMFKPQQHKFDIKLSYSQEAGSVLQSSSEFNTSSAYMVVIDTVQLFSAKEQFVSNNYKYGFDYIKLMPDSALFEYGYMGTSVLSNKKYDVLKNSSETGIYNNTDFVFNYNIHAGYATYSGSLTKYLYKVGLRAEHVTHMYTDSLQNIRLIRLVDLFPSVHVSRKFAKNIQTMASYSRRTSRPKDWYLHPFYRYVSPTNLVVGNPDLLPEFINSFDVSVQKTEKNYSLFAEAFYRETQNKIEKFYSVFDNGDVLTQFKNMSKDISLGLEMKLTYSLLKNVRTNVSGMLYKYSLETANNSFTTKNILLCNAGIDARLPKSWKAQISFSYKSGGVSAQTITSPTLELQAAIKKDWCNNMLSTSLQVYNIANLKKSEEKTTASLLYRESLMREDANVIMFGLQYKINNYSSKKDKKPEGNESNDSQMLME